MKEDNEYIVWICVICSTLILVGVAIGTYIDDVYFDDDELAERYCDIKGYEKSADYNWDEGWVSCKDKKEPEEEEYDEKYYIKGDDD